MLPNAVASLLLGVSLQLLGGFLSSSTTKTLWVSFLTIVQGGIKYFTSWEPKRLPKYFAQESAICG